MFRRQVRQRQYLYAVFGQLALVFWCAGPVNILLFRFAIVNLARLSCKFITDICELSLNFLMQGPHRHAQGRCSVPCRRPGH